MKKLFTLSAMSLAFLTSFSQTFVSTEPENRNAVLEEYTGINCTFCPDGHKIAQQIKDANPNDVVLVNIHAGQYAAPSASQPDFRTEFGQTLFNHTGACGAPAGAVNREVFDGWQQTTQSCTADYAMSRGTWTAAVNQVIAQPSSVNVAARATVDVASRTLTVVVEAYYTDDAETSSNKLNIAVMENNVVGPQSGQSANPAQQLGGGSYNHLHMLRHLITGQWGDAVSPTSAGSFFTETYTWQIPAEHKGIPVKILDLEVAAYISEGNTDIISGSMAEMTYTTPSLSYDAGAVGIVVPEYVCAEEITPSVFIQNSTNTELTSLTIEYDVNGGQTQTFNWTGSLAYAETEEVELPTIAVNHLNENYIWVKTLLPNGHADENWTNDGYSMPFLPAKNSSTDVEVRIVTDYYGSEVSWEIRNESNVVVASGSGFGSNQAYVEDVTGLSSGCHTLVVKDSYGDGFCCAYGNGSYRLRSNNTILYSGNGDIGSEERLPFKVNGTLAVEDLELVNNVAVFPNPFSDNARVSFNMINNAEVSLEVVNVLGAKVISQNLGEKAEGQHKVDLSANALESGIYMVNLLVEGKTYSTRVSITK